MKFSAREIRDMVDTCNINLICYVGNWETGSMNQRAFYKINRYLERNGLDDCYRFYCEDNFDMYMQVSKD